MTRRARVVVLIPERDASDRARAERLARDLSLPCADDDWRDHADLGLAYIKGRLTLLDAARSGARFAVRFDTVPIRHGRVQVSRNEPLGRAFGRDVETIADATAGFGHDAFLLACMGFRVTATERSPIVAALLEDGLRRAREDGRIRQAIDDRLTIIRGDARELLPALAPPPDAAFIDPMFPPKRKKSALPPKTAQMLRKIVGDDPDQMELVDTALAHARHRIVIKRPDDAPPLVPNPVASIHGKLVRYDVYHAPSAPGAALKVGRAQE